MNPVWNTGAFQFEVKSQTDVLHLKVIDLLGEDSQSNIFLGAVQMNLSALLQKMPDRENGVAKGKLEETLIGVSDGQAKIGFAVSFQSYAAQQDSYSGGQPQRSLSYQGSSQAAAPGSYIGQFQIGRIKAWGLASRQSGMFQRFTHTNAYVKTKLRSQGTQRWMRTETIQNSDEPVWEKQKNENWVFNVENRNDEVELYIYNDAIMNDDTPLGTMKIPVAHILDKFMEGQSQPVHDTLRDEQGNLHDGTGLEVTITLLSRR